MKFIHVADLHMDRSFEGLGDVPYEVSRQLMQQNKNVLTEIVDEAIREQVDVVCIVGDTFHQPTVAIQTQYHFIEEMKRLEAVGIYVILSFGNHDYYTEGKYWFSFPSNVLVFDKEEVTTMQLITNKKESVAFSGFSYEHPWINHSKITEFPQRLQEVNYHIGLYHGEQGQVGEHSQQYAPFLISDMKQKQYDYWGLGHIHKPMILSESPWIVYPGAPIGHTKKEKDAHSFAVVECTPSGTEVTWKESHLVEWKRIFVDISDSLTMSDVRQAIETILLKEDTTVSMNLIELVLTGKNDELEARLSMELKNNGLLEYLQERFLIEKQGTVWPFSIKREVTEKRSLASVGVTEELIDQLLERYQEESTFAEVMEELYRQPVLTDIAQLTEEERKGRMDTTKSLLFENLLHRVDGEK